jgi:ABC-2 type transport system permease protein
MRPILNIAQNDLRIFFQDTANWIINLVIIPVVLALVVGLASGVTGGGTPQAASLIVDVIDQDGSAASTNFLELIRANNPAIVLCPMDAITSGGEATAEDQPSCGISNADQQTLFDEALATRRLRDQTSLALIIIPSGLQSALSEGAGASLIYRSNEDVSAPSYILQAVRAAAVELGGAAVAERVALDIADQSGLSALQNPEAREAFGESVRAQAAGLWESPPVTINVVTQSHDADESAASSTGFSQSVPGMGSMYVMFAILPAAALLIQERKNWTLQRLVTMPISRGQVLGGKLLARVVLGMIQYAIIFTFGFFLGVRYGSDPLALILLMLTFTVCITALALMLTTFLHNVAQAQGIALFLSLTLAPLGGAWWTLDIVPDWMRTAGHISPVAWVMDGFHQLIFFGGSLVDVLPMLGVLLVMAVIFFIVGVARFRFE